MPEMVDMPRKQVPPPLELVKGRIEEVLPPEARDRIAAGEVALIDTRVAEDFELGRIEGAVHVPAGENGVDAHSPDVAARITEAAGGKPALLYCGSGNRSARATDALRNEHGVEDVRSMIGGVKLWSELGYPVEGTLPVPEDENEEDQD
jgi:rhodanese-related sulfurtransferase